jgi:hypothetical protein
MDIQRNSRSTLVVVELDLEDRLLFRRRDGREQVIRVVHSNARIHSTTLAKPRTPEREAHTVVRAHVTLEIDGVQVQLVRWFGCDRSFADPYRIAGLELWFDNNTDLFDHLNEDHGSCRPQRRVRLALWESDRRPCPMLLHPWCPLPGDGLRITDCYDSNDCWCGPFDGADAHGGLDINHPAGTVLYTPLAFHRHSFFNHLRDGHNNNRWRGEIDWPDGSVWALQSHHIIELLVPENEPLAAGLPYAITGGMLTGMYEHSHFVFAVKDPADEEEIRVDPWLLFRQMVRDRQGMTAQRHRGIIQRRDPAC